MNTSRKFDVSLERTLVCHSTNANTFARTLALRICRVRILKERKYQLPDTICDVYDVNVFVA